MKKPRKIVVIGGVAGGASAAARARRVDENADITIFERGPHISFANCGLPYFISGEIEDRKKLILMTPEKFWERSRVLARVNHEVIAIDRAAREVLVRLPEGGEERVRYDRLILSQGAKPIVPPIPGADLPHVFTLRDIPDMDRIAAFIENEHPRRAVVVGGGFIGLEMAEAFHHRGIEVSIVEKAPHALPLLDDDMAALAQNKLRSDGLHLKVDSEVARISPGSVALTGGENISADMVLLSIGVKAEVELARAAGLDIGITGGVRVNGRLESSDPAIYAVGDAAETVHAITGARSRIALAGPANRQGRIAGTNAAGGHAIYKGALGTSVVRVLNATVALVGLNSAQAARAGLSFFTSMTRDHSHAHYYPGAKPIVTKLIAEEATGRLLGAQLIGEIGVDKRVDVLATAISAGMNVFDLESLDLAYSPPFSSANDPVNVAGFVAGHIARGDIATIAPENWKRDGELLLDVREPDEVDEFGHLKGAVNIPLGKLRDALDCLPANRRIVTYCQKGQRGYLAACALAGAGFENVANLRGGFLQAELNGWPVVPPLEAED